MKRLSATALVRLADDLDSRDREILETVARLRLLAGKQLERLCFFSISKPASRARAARRVLASLTDRGVLFRLERRIGGARAGSAGHIFGLGPVGKRLIAYWQGEGLAQVRTPHEPSLIFVRHTLAVAEQYVRLQEAERSAEIELLAFEAEPDCWRPIDGHETLKPDAFVRLGVDADFEERNFLEVDCGTTGRGALIRKCQRYVRYCQGGTEQAEAGVFPRIVWITTTDRRVQLLGEVFAALPTDSHRLFMAGLSSQLVELCTGADRTPAAPGAHHV
jgi:hypothetical protein